MRDCRYVENGITKGERAFYKESSTAQSSSQDLNSDLGSARQPMGCVEAIHIEQTILLLR